MDAITKDSKEWLAALKVAGKWEPNQRCRAGEYDPSAAYGWRYFCTPCHITHMPERDHLGPPPDITPDLLYTILEAGLQRKIDFLSDVMMEMDVPEGRTPKPLADAIIRAAASLQEAK